MTIEKHKAVTIHYTLKDKDGAVVDSSDGRDPLAYIHGIGNIVVGLEEALEGKAKGDKLDVEVPPSKGYGERVEDLVKSAPKDQFKELEPIQVGTAFHINTPQGPMPATISDIVDDVVFFDLNHPLADKTLYFSVEIMDVRDATSEELDHGHVHGPGGHQH